MTSREIVRRAVRFEGVDRIPYDLTTRYGSDFAWVSMTPSPDARPKSGVDEWGCVWANIGVSSLGEVEDAPLKEWDDWGLQNRIRVAPDIERMPSLPCVRSL